MPVPKIKELNRALKGHAKSYGIELQDNLNPLNHFTKTKTLVKLQAITKKVQGCKQSEEMENEKNKRSYTEAYQTHEDCGSAFKVICCYDDKNSKDICIYRGENAVYKFMETMLEEVKYCKAVIKKHFNKPLVMTEVDEKHLKLWMGVTFVVKSALTKMCTSETIATSLENSGAQLTKSVT